MPPKEKKKDVKTSPTTITIKGGNPMRNVPQNEADKEQLSAQNFELRQKRAREATPGGFSPFHITAGSLSTETDFFTSKFAVDQRTEEPVTMTYADLHLHNDAETFSDKGKVNRISLGSHSVMLEDALQIEESQQQLDPFDSSVAAMSSNKLSDGSALSAKGGSFDSKPASDGSALSANTKKKIKVDPSFANGEFNPNEPTSVPPESEAPPLEFTTVEFSKYASPGPVEKDRSQSWYHCRPDQMKKNEKNSTNYQAMFRRLPIGNFLKANEHVAKYYIANFFQFCWEHSSNETKASTGWKAGDNPDELTNEKKLEVIFSDHLTNKYDNITQWETHWAEDVGQGETKRDIQNLTVEEMVAILRRGKAVYRAKSHAAVMKRFTRCHPFPFGVHGMPPGHDYLVTNGFTGFSAANLKESYPANTRTSDMLKPHNAMWPKLVSNPQAMVAFYLVTHLNCWLTGSIVAATNCHGLTETGLHFLFVTQTHTKVDESTENVEGTLDGRPQDHGKTAQVPGSALYGCSGTKLIAWAKLTSLAGAVVRARPVYNQVVSQITDWEKIIGCHLECQRELGTVIPKGIATKKVGDDARLTDVVHHSVGTCTNVKHVAAGTAELNELHKYCLGTIVEIGMTSDGSSLDVVARNLCTCNRQRHAKINPGRYSCTMCQFIPKLMNNNMKQESVGIVSISQQPPAKKTKTEGTGNLKTEGDVK